MFPIPALVLFLEEFVALSGLSRPVAEALATLELMSGVGGESITSHSLPPTSCSSAVVVVGTPSFSRDGLELPINLRCKPRRLSFSQEAVDWVLAGERLSLAVALPDDGSPLLRMWSEL